MIKIMMVKANSFGWQQLHHAPLEATKWSRTKITAEETTYYEN